MGAILLMLAVTTLCELHEVFFHDWSARIYMYEAAKKSLKGLKRPFRVKDWTGLTILALNCLLFLEAWRSMRDTFLMEEADEVRSFYTAVSLVSILYFLSLPLVCLLATLLSPHVRAKYVDRCEAFKKAFGRALSGQSAGGLSIPGHHLPRLPPEVLQAL